MAKKKQKRYTFQIALLEHNKVAGVYPVYVDAESEAEAWEKFPEALNSDGFDEGEDWMYTQQFTITDVPVEPTAEAITPESTEGGA